MRKISLALAGLLMAGILSTTAAKAWGEGPGHCGKYMYWDTEECECVDARDD